MQASIAVVYENGVFRLVSPLPEGIPEHQRFLVVIETPDPANDWLAAADPSVSLENVRRAMSRGPTTLAQMVWEEREER